MTYTIRLINTRERRMAVTCRLMPGHADATGAKVEGLFTVRHGL